MKRLAGLLAILLLLCGCGQQQPPATTAPAVQSSPEAQYVRLDFYAINDLHGKLIDSAAQPGVDELSLFLKRSPNAILLSTGDMWQGASESNLTEGRIMTEWMNEMGFAAMTLGGHEYDWGEVGIRSNQQLAQFPFLAINIFSRSTGQQADYCQSSAMVTVEGVDIGIIGAIGDCYGSIASRHTEDVYFKSGAELTALVKEEATRLRREGADLIVYAIHDGFDQNSSGVSAMAVTDQQLSAYYDISLSEGFVDLVFEADTHFSYVLADSRGIYHLQAGGNNSAISHAGVLINKTTGECSVLSAEILSAGSYGVGEKDPAVAQLLEKYAEQLAPAGRILGSNGHYRNGYQLSQLVAELYCAKGAELWEEPIFLAGGYLSCRSPGYLLPGDVSYSQLQALFPFDNQIVLCTIRGQDLIDRFLETQNDAYFLCLTEYGQSLRDQVDPNGVYYVVTDRYTSDYAYNRMTVVAAWDADLFARDLLADYIAQGGMES